MTIKKGDVICVFRDSLLYDVIEKIILSDITHVALYIGNDLIIESTMPEVIMQTIHKYPKKGYFVYKFPERFKIDKEQLVKDCMSKLGTRYGYLQFAYNILLSIIIRIFPKLEKFFWKKFKDVDDGVICTELIAEAVMKQGFKFGNIENPAAVSTEDYVKYLEKVK